MSGDRFRSPNKPSPACSNLKKSVLEPDRFRNMEQFSVLSVQSSYQFLASQSGCSTSAITRSTQTVVGVPNCKPRECKFVRCNGFVRGIGWNKQVMGESSRRNGSRSGNGRRNLAVRSQGRSESGVNWMSRGSPYSVLGVPSDCTEEDIKVAFRNRIKEFHPDVYKGTEDADAITQRIIRAYEILTNQSVERIYRRKNTDPFEDPECEAEDVFVFEMNCIGRGCPYPCVSRAPDVFKFAADTGCARAVTQGGPGQGEDYGVQLAVGQCPRNCIYWVTPMQRDVLEDLMARALEGTTYSSELVTLETLISRASYENGKYQPPKLKRQPTSTEQWVDWF